MSSEVASRRRRLAVRLTAAALVFSVGLLVTALLAPVYNGQTTSDANGLTLSSATYVQRNGAWVLIPLAVPLAAGLAAVAALAGPGPRRRRVAVLAVAALAVLGIVLILTGGVLLLVPAALLALALRLTRPVAEGQRGRRVRETHGRPAQRPPAEGPVTPTEAEIQP